MRTSCVQPGNNSPVFLLEEIQRTQNNKSRVRAGDRVVEAVCPGTLAGSSLHFSLHRTGQSRASGPGAQMWPFVSGPKAASSFPIGGLLGNWAIWLEVFGDRQGDFVQRTLTRDVARGGPSSRQKPSQSCHGSCLPTL